MKFVTFDQAGTDVVGRVIGSQIHGLPPATALLDLLGDGGERLAEAGERAETDPSVVVDLEQAALRAPIPNPPTVRDFMTFEQHVEGALKAIDPAATIPDQWYLAPTFYFTNPYSIRGPQDDVELPPRTQRFDFELELAAVVGRPGRDIAVEDAEQHVAGFLILNDWSARDVQFAEMQVRLGPCKGKDTATTLGPFFVTPDELEPYRKGNAYDLTATARVNGQVIGQDNWSNMNFSYAQMLAYASRAADVRTGDVLGSGTIGGGCLAEHWGQGEDSLPPLREGDVVELEVEHLGVQRSRIVAQQAPAMDQSVFAATGVARTSAQS
ncbi:fumarylacetoacetate hydrolase family protein [Rhodococcus opacus]|uniref:Fumarylacetoacetate hydrolase family protein n=1 Tax=Rhodococcus opacus TaxID=37919 RepID=A0AAX3YRG9_RHOOP|nr:fumarylacetoacetate hydrolase family protein [Rhodococcus opacus]MCZ4585967.1 fumarylacetoacetate hydrolase family protein [Rhodococcus opacus]WLF52077.1 fumarylacetoacetate hydrolase family protein [Rhodococcus opacus]